MAFSLLEVIIATAIVASSAIVLLRLISTGQQHQQRAERRATAQMICQSVVDEMTIDSWLIESVEEQRVAGYPDWTYSTTVEPAEYDGLVRVRIRAALQPIDLQQERTLDDGKFDFELIRWLRTGDDQSSDRSTSGDRDGREDASG